MEKYVLNSLRLRCKLDRYIRCIIKKGKIGAFNCYIDYVYPILRTGDIAVLVT